MDTVHFTYKRGGRTKKVSTAQAKVLSRAGLGTYQTRDMARQPMVVKPMQAEPVAAEPIVEAAPAAIEQTVQTEQTDDGLETMEKEQLHALAKERGVKVHHLAGADKVRAALREVQE